MRTNTTYAIYWIPSGYSVDANYESLINRYLKDVAAASGSQTNVYSVATQYYDNAAAVHYQSTFAGSYVDTDPFPASGCDAGGGVCLTDDQIQHEIQKVLDAEGWHASTTTMFFVMTPHGVASCFDGATDQCSTNYFCAYHSGFYSANHVPVLYANEPYDADVSACSSGASPNGDAAADTELSTISHEHNETITDPAGDAWLSASGAEIGDLCAWHFGSQLGTAANGQPYNQLINGHEYWLQEEYSNDGSTCLQRYTPTAAPSTVALPVLSGAAGEGRLLFTSEGSWMHAPSGYAYTWQRCTPNGTGCADISGASAAAYRLTAADVGHTVRAEVRAWNAAGTSAASASAATSVVVPLPASTARPVLSGAAAVGRRLFTTTGAWNSTVTVAYQWLRCAADGTGCTAIPGARSPSYVPAAADTGHMLEAQVAATNAAGTTTADSDPITVFLGAPASRQAPRISGRARVGRRLSASKGSWSGAPAAYRFRWVRCNSSGGSCVSISRATSSTYRLTKHDARHRLRVQVTALNAAGSSTATSRATAHVPAGKH